MEFLEVIIFILVIIAVLYRNIQKENEKARKRNIAKPAPAEPLSSTREEDAEISSTLPEYENKQPTADYSARNITVNPSSIQSQHIPNRKYKKEKTQYDKTETHKNKKNAASAGIQLNTAEEARRAFIYSEIFNRKY